MSPVDSNAIKPAIFEHVTRQRDELLSVAKQAVDFHQRLVLPGSIGHSADKRRRKK